MKYRTIFKSGDPNTGLVQYSNIIIKYKFISSNLLNINTFIKKIGRHE